MDSRYVQAIATSVRTLSMDAIQKANSGHPGLPLGCAELGAYLYGEAMTYNPADPSWANRDRFVLSAGHGSMFLYSLLHLSGFAVSLDDIKNFRQLGSRTPGHPEFGWTPGVETTTGPLGQGLATAVGIAMGERMTAARFNTDGQTIVDYYTYVLAGDGCLMEGITGEASSLAGHLGLGKLIVFYDSNKITIDGTTDLAFSEDVAARYASFGWQVLSGDAYDIPGIARMVAEAKADTGRPSIIILTSVIGKSAPTKAGSHEAHGAPLGAEEIIGAKKSMGLSGDESFYVDPLAVEFFKKRREELAAKAAAWKAVFDAWSVKNPALRKEWDEKGTPIVLDDSIYPAFAVGDSLATRAASGKVIGALAKSLPRLAGGSADLTGPNATSFSAAGVFSRSNPAGRMIHFGVREHAMAAIANGITLSGQLRAFCATFLVFADYLRPSLRLSALMGLPVIYVFTHDSVFVGEDGPTHQPIEHLESLRLIPNVSVFRPADALDTVSAWKSALARTEGPSVIVLTRQNISVFARDSKSWSSDAALGAYAVNDVAKPDVVVAATGSEVSLALSGAALSGRSVRVVSVICREMLERDASLSARLFPAGVPVVTVEAGRLASWAGFPGFVGGLSVERFGESGPAAKVAEHVGLTAEAVASLIRKA